jgi:hypothetical protein
MWCQMRGRFQTVVRGLLLAAAMAGLALTAGPAYAQFPVSSGVRHGPTAPIRMLASAVVGQSPLHRRDKVTYVVRADIDGHSILTLSGKSARWFHIDFAAPGRHFGKNEPTIINGTKWFPTWPQPGENRDCHCFSSTFTNVMPRVPKKAVVVSFKAVSCRDSCSIKYSDGALVIDFNDNPSSSDAWYEVKVTLTRHKAGVLDMS